MFIEIIEVEIIEVKGRGVWVGGQLEEGPHVRGTSGESKSTLFGPCWSR
jgi:hypothetical protein